MKSASFTFSNKLVCIKCIIYDFMLYPCFVDSGGDMELLSTLQKMHHICANPTRIMCRDANTLKEAADSGQNVTCDLEFGLKCFDYQNDGRCYDYEITVYCACACKLSLLHHFYDGI